MKHYLISILLLLLPVAAQGDQLINSRAPEFFLHDQHDRPVTLRQLEGRVVVLLASDRDGSAQNRRWGKIISDRYGATVSLIVVANARGVPFFMKNKVKNDFKKDEISVLLDWNGVVSTAYGLADKVSNIILIDKNGYIRHMYSGESTEGAIERLFAEIDRTK